jgi:phospholipase C
MWVNFNNIWQIIFAIFLFDCSCFSQKISPRELENSQLSAWNNIEHVVVIMLENTSYEAASKQPYMKSLKSQGASLDQYHAVAHPSQPNYIALIAGDTLGVDSDKNYDLNANHLGDLLEAANKTWKVYAEEFPGNCSLKARVGNYVRKHVPFISFSNVHTDPERCNNIVSAKQFDVDIKNNQLPTFSLYIPNMLNNAHDTNISFADNWLHSYFEPYFTNQDYLKNTLFIVTFDEDDYFHLNRIYAVFLGAGVKIGATSHKHYDHYSLLRTFEDMFGLSDLGRNDLSAQPITDIWE